MFPGADYERVAPAACDNCGGSAFERKGRVGLWDGSRGSGCTYEAVCLGCRAVWHSLSDPFACRDRPESLHWFQRDEPE
jgi:hypothetical protein